MKENILSKPNEIVGGFVKDLIQTFEDRYRKYNQTGEVQGLTKEDISAAASKWDLESCGYQIYFLALGMYCGCVKNFVPQFYQSMTWCRDCGEAAERLSKELDIPINEINSKEALKYYEGKE